MLDVFKNIVFVHDNDRVYCTLWCNVISLATAAQWYREWISREATFGQTGTNFEKDKLWVLKVSNLPQNVPKMEDYSAPKLPKMSQNWAKVVVIHGKICAIARKHKFRYATSQFFGDYLGGKTFLPENMYMKN